jgi:hypothetical protein
MAELHVWEPLAVKCQILSSAVELANMVLKIDCLFIEKSEEKALRAEYEKKKGYRGTSESLQEFKMVHSTEVYMKLRISGKGEYL